MPNFSSLENAEVEYLRGKANGKSEELRWHSQFWLYKVSELSSPSGSKGRKRRFPLKVSKD